MKSSNLNCRLGESKIMTMCLIYLLAGAFAVVSKAMGGVDAVVI
jgi:Na+/H+ antiporter NhaC